MKPALNEVISLEAEDASLREHRRRRSERAVLEVQDEARLDQPTGRLLP
jgi:hypothetical protein